MSKKLLTGDAFTYQKSDYGQCFRYVFGKVQIVFGVSHLNAGWEQEIYIPYDFSEDPVMVVTSNNGATVSVTNRYTNRAYCYASAECYVNWIAIGKC